MPKRTPKPRPAPGPQAETATARRKAPQPSENAGILLRIAVSLEDQGERLERVEAALEALRVQVAALRENP